MDNIPKIHSVDLMNPTIIEFTVPLESNHNLLNAAVIGDELFDVKFQRHLMYFHNMSYELAFWVHDIQDNGDGAFTIQATILTTAEIAECRLDGTLPAYYGLFLEY